MIMNSVDYVVFSLPVSNAGEYVDLVSSSLHSCRKFRDMYTYPSDRN